MLTFDALIRQSSGFYRHTFSLDHSSHERCHDAKNKVRALQHIKVSFNSASITSDIRVVRQVGRDVLKILWEG